MRKAILWPISLPLCLSVHLFPSLLNNILCFSISQVAFNGWPMTFQLWRHSTFTNCQERSWLVQFIFLSSATTHGQPTNGRVTLESSPIPRSAGPVQGPSGTSDSLRWGHEQVPQNLPLQSLGRGWGGPTELGHSGTTTHHIVFLVWNSQGPSPHPFSPLYQLSILHDKPLQKLAHKSLGQLSSSGLAQAWLILAGLAQHLWSAGRSAGPLV